MPPEFGSPFFKSKETSEDTHNIELKDNDHVVFQTVHSDEEAYQMYKEYAHKVGFSVRKEHILYWTHTRTVKSREFSCAKAGFKRSNPVKDANKKYHKLDTRTGCLACLHFRADKDGRNWEIIRFVEEHNHPLAPQNDSHLLRSHRIISDVQGSMLKNMTSAGIRTVDAYNFIADEVGGFENVGFAKIDAYNYVQRERRALIESGDATSLLKIFQDRQMEDSMFSYAVQTDEYGHLKSFCWMDGHSRIDYDSFNDVIIFDTTYRMNKYNLACAPFIGINHHWQNIFMGGAFVAEETIESFCWVFETFLRFAGGKQPSTMFTDQDQAMSVAIARVFTSTRHRLCQWHICKKAPSKVPTFNNDKSIRALFYQCMSKCETEDEFDSNWSVMIRRGNLEDNRWLSDLYQVRRKWSTTFNKDILDLGILSTQRSESANHVLHDCTKPTSSLVECFSGMEKMISSWRRSEHDEDFKCKQSSITLKFKNCLLLKQASKVYTRKMFSIFEQIFMDGAVSVSITEEVKCDDYMLYITRHCDASVDDDKHWLVKIDCNTYDAMCSCKGFETRGFLCKHILRIYNSKNVRQINSKYFLKRFTLAAKKDLYLSRSTCLKDNQSSMIFRNHLMRFTYELAQLVDNCQPAQQHVLTAMNELRRTAEEIIDQDKGLKKQNVERNVNGTDLLRDPKGGRRKGLSKVRLKSFFEKPSKKQKRKQNPIAKTEGEGAFEESKEIDFLGTASFQAEPSIIPENISSELKDEVCQSVPYNFCSVPDVLRW